MKITLESKSTALPSFSVFGPELRMAEAAVPLGGLTTPPDAAPNHGPILSVRLDTGYDNGDEGGK